MSSESLKLELTCAPVRRIHNSSKYQPASYEVDIYIHACIHTYVHTCIHNYIYIHYIYIHTTCIHTYINKHIHIIIPLVRIIIYSQVALKTKDGHSFSFISKEIPNESTDLHKLITQDLHNVYNIHTLSVQSLSVQGQPSDIEHIISIFFVVPTDTGKLKRKAFQVD